MSLWNNLCISANRSDHNRQRGVESKGGENLISSQLMARKDFSLERSSCDKPRALVCHAPFAVLHWRSLQELWSHYCNVEKWKEILPLGHGKGKWEVSSPLPLPFPVLFVWGRLNVPCGKNPLGCRKDHCALINNASWHCLPSWWLCCLWRRAVGRLSQTCIFSPFCLSGMGDLKSNLPKTWGGGAAGWLVILN